VILNKLTSKALSVLKSFPKNKKTQPVKEIINQIVIANGLGKIILQNITFFDNKKTININLLIKEAFNQAYKLDHPFVGTEHLILAFLVITKSREYEKAKEEVEKYSVFSKNIKDLSPQTPLLNQFAKDLTLEVLKNNSIKLVQRDAYKYLLSSLMLKSSSGVIITGDFGVGRQSLINLLAFKTSTIDVPIPLLGYKLIEIDFLNFMLSGFSKPSMEIGINSLVEELKLLGKIIIVLKNIDNLILTNSSGVSIPLAFNLFKNILKENNIKIIAKLSANLYEKISSEQESVLDDFSVVEVEEPTDKELLEILKSVKPIFQKHHNVIISDLILDYLVLKSNKILLEVALPKKAILILDLACAVLNNKKNIVNSKFKDLMIKSAELLTDIEEHIDLHNFDIANNKRQELIKTENVLDKIEDQYLSKNKIFSLSTKDIDFVIETYFTKTSSKSDKDINNLSKLYKVINQKVIGQQDAVNKTVKALIRSKLGLRTKKRPLGNFLFLGPTGVGKTELAKVLAESFYGLGSLIRLDMSDFGEKHNIARLVGAPPGYVGYGDGGELTSKISNNPNSVVLFDEIEKAHPDVLNILLQIMDEGELKDAKGNTFDFSKSVIILTSNAGTNIVHMPAIGFIVNDISHVDLESRLKNNLKKIMKPELLNRFDEIIIFKQLNKKDQEEILNLLIEEIRTTLNNQKIALKITKLVKDFILEKGYSKDYGVRALRRVLETELLDVVAEHLLNNSTRPLNIKLNVKDNKIVIE